MDVTEGWSALNSTTPSVVAGSQIAKPLHPGFWLLTIWLGWLTPSVATTSGHIAQGASLLQGPACQPKYIYDRAPAGTSPGQALWLGQWASWARW